ncbi:(4Fe-4S)-binding protein [Parabacteroides johnsonii]|uniref:(4Fe-4S)-binding protein n=1 Tax=Parabacteroides johnsonii TaxID=387661 RepID=A0A9Q5SSH9_9BACT|nr:EFR1 family ferrodoxin [Parabacteroides johnsonii]OUO06067.1 (4Fe-4S)-binding protein [Parabacteroides johnsonii]
MSTDKKISRRNALKRMGTVVVSSVIASSGMFSLASCEAKRNKRIIFYFTGTGNCLYIARQLAGENAELLSIPQMVKRGKYDFEADEIGLVYPIYGHMPLYMVRQFIQKAKLSAKYKFAVLTYGARKCDSVEIWDRISRKAGNAFDYIGTIVMVDNWLPNFDMNEQIKIDKHIPENLQKIMADINQQKHWHEPVTEEERQQHQGFMQRSGLDPEVGFLMKSEKCFTVTDACIDCGICTYVCPRGNYELTSRGVKTSGDCEFCFACIQNCPQKAIQFRKSEDGSFPDGTEKNPNARYRNEHISLMDLKLANNQKL